MYWVRYFDGYVMTHSKPRWGLAHNLTGKDIRVVDLHSLQAHTVDEGDIVESTPVYLPFVQDGVYDQYSVDEYIHKFGGREDEGC